MCKCMQPDSSLFGWWCLASCVVIGWLSRLLELANNELCQQATGVK